MATVDDIKNALKAALGKNGGLQRIEAQAKSEIYFALNKEAPQEECTPDAQSDDINYIVNELILEYLRFNSLKFSESVFRSEAKHKHDPISRRLLCQCLNVKPTVSARAVSKNSIPKSTTAHPPVDTPVPLLYYFVQHFKTSQSQ
uniref:Centrosomal protein 43 n=1 Tax=Mesocestoides corti TaxID=53468 RepID=A0A5K3EZC3_MESCO